MLEFLYCDFIQIENNPENLELLYEYNRLLITFIFHDSVWANY